jgi:hypothetical protein
VGRSVRQLFDRRLLQQARHQVCVQ